MRTIADGIANQRAGRGPGGRVVGGETACDRRARCRIERGVRALGGETLRHRPGQRIGRSEGGRVASRNGVVQRRVDPGDARRDVAVHRLEVGVGADGVERAAADERAGDAEREYEGERSAGNPGEKPESLTEAELRESQLQRRSSTGRRRAGNALGLGHGLRIEATFRAGGGGRDRTRRWALWRGWVAAVGCAIARKQTNEKIIRCINPPVGRSPGTGRVSLNNE